MKSNTIELRGERIMITNGKRLEKVYEQDVKNGTVCIPINVEIISVMAFENIRSLQYITIPHHVKYICESAFENCKNLETVKIENNSCIMEECIFRGCENLQKINWPKGLNSEIYI